MIARVVNVLSVLGWAAPVRGFRDGTDRSAADQWERVRQAPVGPPGHWNCGERTLRR